MTKLSHRQQFPRRLMTAEEFSQRDPDTREELVRGRVVPLVGPKPLHGIIAAKITARLVSFVEAHDLGYVLAESGYTDVQILGPDDTLSGDDVLPGFSCPVAALL